MFENLKRGGLIAESRSFEDEQELIQEEAPDLDVPAEPEPEPAPVPAPEDEPA
jgi:hypothetical protein